MFYSVSPFPTEYLLTAKKQSLKGHIEKPDCSVFRRKMERRWGSILSVCVLTDSRKCWGLLNLCKPIQVVLCTVMSDFLQPRGLQPTRLLSMEFSRQEYWSELPFPPPEDLPNPQIKPAALTTRALAGFFTTAPPQTYIILLILCQTMRLGGYSVIQKHPCLRLGFIDEEPEKGVLVHVLY